MANGAQGDPSHWLIQVGMDRSEEDEILADYQENLSYVLLAALVICTSTPAGYQIARRGIRPIYEITQAAGNTRPSNSGERIAMTGSAGRAPPVGRHVQCNDGSLGTRV